MLEWANFVDQETSQDLKFWEALIKEADLDDDGMVMIRSPMLPNRPYFYRSTTMSSYRICTKLISESGI